METKSPNSFVGFAAVGFISTVLDFIVLNVCLKLLAPTWLATAAGFLTGLTNGYFMNSRYVFKKDKTHTRYIKYLVVSLGGLIWTELIVNGLHDGAHIAVNLAKLVAVCLVFFWNYFLSKVWVFS